MDKENERDLQRGLTETWCSSQRPGSPHMEQEPPSLRVSLGGIGSRPTQHKPLDMGCAGARRWTLTEGSKCLRPTALRNREQ